MGGATSAIIRILDKAEKSILVQAYSFTSAPITSALARAHKKGVEVQVILDKSQETAKYSSADLLINAGIETLFDAAHDIAHNKVMIIDHGTVVTGSFNFTNAAEERNLPRIKQLLMPRLIQNPNPLRTPFGGTHQCGDDWYTWGGY